MKIQIQDKNFAVIDEKGNYFSYVIFKSTGDVLLTILTNNTFKTIFLNGVTGEPETYLFSS
jgi:hypothetical protein